MIPAFVRSRIAIARRILRAIFLRRRLDNELDEEMRFHLELSTAALVERGMSVDEAARAARREFGNVGRVTDVAREIKRVTLLEHFAFDLRSGWRAARRAPVVTATAVVMLGLGIGSTTTMFSITHGILRDLPVADAARLVHVAAIQRRSGAPESRINDWEFQAIRSELRALEGLGGVIIATFHLGDPNRFSERWSGAAITPNVFHLLGVGPALGRDFSERDALPGAPPVVILGATLWRQHFRSDSTVIGRTARVNGVLRTVVGVMRDGFRFPLQEDLWIPQVPETAPPADGAPAWLVFGRLRRGSTMGTARAELASLDSTLGVQTSDRISNRRLRLRPYREQQFSRKVLPIFGAMLFIVSFVLFIACANVAGLLLAQGAVRRREMAVRSALGATSGRLTVQLLSEVLLLATGGGILGLALATAGVAIFNAVAGFELAFWMLVRVDATVLAWATLLVVAAALLAGVAPARLAARVDVGEVLKSASRGSSGHRVGRLSRALVGFEVALSATLLVVTALMIEGVRLNVRALTHVRPEMLQVTRIELPAEAYPTADRRRRFLAAVETSLTGRPGVRDVSLSSALPGIGGADVPIQIDGVGEPDATYRATTTSASLGFFRIFGAEMLEGPGVRSERRRSRTAGGHREPAFRPEALCRCVADWTAHPPHAE